MQCSCGGQTVDRTVTENKKVVTQYVACADCGRVGMVRDVRNLDRDKALPNYQKELQW